MLQPGFASCNKHEWARSVERLCVDLAKPVHRRATFDTTGFLKKPANAPARTCHASKNQLRPRSRWMRDALEMETLPSEGTPRPELRGGRARARMLLAFATPGANSQNGAWCASRLKELVPALRKSRLPFHVNTAAISARSRLPRSSRLRAGICDHARPRSVHDDKSEADRLFVGSPQFRIRVLAIAMHLR